MIVSFKDETDLLKETKRRVRVRNLAQSQDNECDDRSEYEELGNGMKPFLLDYLIYSMKDCKLPVKQYTKEFRTRVDCM